jgi:uncharacterized membrane protein
LDLYGAVVFVHATTILLFFIAHGTSMAVAFALQRETDPARVRALLDLSRFSLGVPVMVLIVLGLLSGILAGFMGGHWGTGWLWISIVLFVLVGGLMTPLATFRLKPMRAAAGMPAETGVPEAPPQENPEELRRLIDAWNPLVPASMGLVAFIVILYLMLAKPF